MLRDLMTFEDKVYDTTYTAHANLVRGMAVLKGTDGKTAFESGAESATPASIATSKLNEVFFVDREQIAEGIYAGLTIMPDYSDNYENIAQGKDLKLKKYVSGESFATDQITGTPTNGQYLGLDEAIAGADATQHYVANGKLKIVADATMFICRGSYTDCGHTLYKVDVL